MTAPGSRGPVLGRPQFAQGNMTGGPQQRSSGLPDPNMIRAFQNQAQQANQANQTGHAQQQVQQGNKAQYNQNMQHQQQAQMRQQQEEQMRMAQQNKMQHDAMIHGKQPLVPGGQGFGPGNSFGDTLSPGAGLSPMQPTPAQQGYQNDPNFNSQVMKLALSNIMKQYQNRQGLGGQLQQQPPQGQSFQPPVPQ